MVATPTFTHEEFVCGALAKGKAVFSEKPLAETEEGTAKCYNLAKEKGAILFCAFNRRFDPSFASTYNRVRKGRLHIKLCKLSHLSSILTGELGHIHVAKTTSRDSPLPSIGYLKISGGIFHDCAVHDIDLITWIMGELPVEVYSNSNARIPEIKALNDFDNVSINMKFKSGMLVHLLT